MEVRWRGHRKFHGHPYVLKAPNACIWGGCLKFSSLEVLGLHFHHQHPRPFGLFVLMEYFPQGDKGVAVVEEDRFEKLSCLDTGKTLMGNNLNDVGRMFNFYSPPVLIAGDICDSHS